MYLARFNFLTDIVITVDWGQFKATKEALLFRFDLDFSTSGFNPIILIIVKVVRPNIRIFKRLKLLLL